MVRLAVLALLASTLMVVAGIGPASAATGEITGTVTDAATAADLAGICVYATGPDFRSDVTDVNGDYSIGGLDDGDYTVYFEDCLDIGDFASEVFNGVASFSLATPVTVAGGGTTTGIDADLDAAGHLEGTVTADAGGAPLENICVFAWSDNNGFSGFDVTDAAGNYDIGGLPTDSYNVEFYDFGSCGGTGDFLEEYFDDTRDYSAALPVGVVSGAATSGVDAGLAEAAHVTGTVRAQSGVPLADICVSVSEIADPPVTFEGGFDYTDAQGNYDIGGLPADSYKVAFSDCNNTGPFVSEFYNDTVNEAAATPVNLNAGDTRSGVNAWLVFVPAVPTHPRDTTAPTVDLRTPPSAAVYTLNDVVAADFSCADEAGGSGLGSCVGTVADGAPIDTATAGSRTFTVTATDGAANITTVTHTYTVDATPPPPAPTCHGEVVTVDLAAGDSPTDEADVIKGTSAGEVIAALGGDDVVCAGGGDDVVTGGAGGDVVRGGSGDDRLKGQAGDDELRGGPGIDNCRGGGGTDTAFSCETVVGVP